MPTSGRKALEVIRGALTDFLRVSLHNEHLVQLARDRLLNLLHQKVLLELTQPLLRRRALLLPE